MRYLAILPLIASASRLAVAIPADTAAVRAASTADDDIDTVKERRFATIVGATTGATSIQTWLSTQSADGSWPDVDYTTGCNAPTANWKAETHWSRILTFSAGWHGGFKNAAQWTQDSTIRAAISSAMNFWFENDFPIPACLDQGGTDACPCGSPGCGIRTGSVVGIPTSVGEACLLLGDSLIATELDNCVKFTSRSFATFDTGIVGVSNITGANLQDIASIGIDQGLLQGNVSLVSAGFDHVHSDALIQNGTKADGIRADGSFGQHAGIIYNGNYGKDYENDLFSFEIEAAGTQFQASDAARSSLETLVDAIQWMIFRNVFTNVLHWDFSVLGRLMTDPVSDNHASANIKTNLTQIQVIGELWDSDVFSDVFNNLNLNTTTANSGNLMGSRVFFANDYFVQRGPGYVTTLRMYSKRTQNTECTASANNFGFHLADGTVYTHINGDEYEDIVAAWDWNLIPGITVDYGGTVLSCSMTRKTGTQTMVGGATDGTVAAVAMRYENPINKSLNWRKTWLFLDDDVQLVMVARVSVTNTSTPVLSVLDQRKLSGSVFVNGAASTGGNFSHPSTLWHGGVGYAFNTSNPVTLTVDASTKTGNWSAIGASSAGAISVDMFTAYLTHNDLSASIAYLVFPGTTASSFASKAATAAQTLAVIRNDGSISALLDAAHGPTAYGVFWDATGGAFTVPAAAAGGATIRLTSTGSASVIVRMDSWEVTVADPTQLLASLTLTFTLGSGSAPAGWGTAKTKTLSFTLPSGGLAGASVTQTLPSSSL
ncbi:polysaccharide lyase family 8 protein [Epithele typhae]|uniref:polysaccharide lyase family 8 protein n=1 Tax=Epithele typhae TaxID=378194 RepID=UPI002007F386|nr:polysaccharide lyase family 8 protein [Epithele typhae]KAH9944408.1 polysaccharide lyase family 8 protein [Epithele typhae]